MGTTFPASPFDTCFLKIFINNLCEYLGWSKSRVSDSIYKDVFRSHIRPVILQIVQEEKLYLFRKRDIHMDTGFMLGFADEFFIPVDFIKSQPYDITWPQTAFRSDKDHAFVPDATFFLQCQYFRPEF